MASLSFHSSLLASSPFLSQSNGCFKRERAPLTSVVAVYKPEQPQQKPPLPSRRAALSLLGLSVLLASTQRPALARDIPLFGLRKKVQKAEEEIVKEAKELMKEGEKDVSKLVREGEKEISSAVETLAESGGKVASVPAYLQAGAVAGAELVAVAVASSVVNGILSEQ